MKRFFLYLLVLLPTLLHAQSTIYLKIAQRHDDYVGGWQGSDSVVFAYNTDGRLIAQTMLQGQAGNVWNNDARYSYQLNPAGQVTEQLRENWSGSAWVNANRYTYSYDVQANLTLTLYEVWNGSAWIPSGKIENSGYNMYGGWGLQLTSVYSGGQWQNLYRTAQQFVAGSGKVEFREKENWNTVTAIWDKFERLYYTYVQDSVGTITRSVPDTNNNWSSADKYSYAWSPSFLLQSYLQQYWNKDSMKFVDTTRVLYTYNGSNLEDLRTSERRTGGVWLPLQRTNTLYGPGNLRSEWYTEAFAGGWQNFERGTYSYTGNLCTEEDLFTGAASTWTPSKKHVYSYDVNNNLIFRQRDDFNGSAFAPYSRDFYYYGAYTLGLSEALLPEPLQLHPNPAKDRVFLRFRLPESGNYVIRLFDLQGRLRCLRTDKCANEAVETSLSVAALPAGLYSLQVLHLSSGYGRTVTFQIFP